MCPLSISRHTSAPQSFHVQWLKGSWGFSALVPLWSTFLVMNVVKNVQTEKTLKAPKAWHMDCNEIIFSLFLFFCHRFICRMFVIICKYAVYRTACASVTKLRNADKLDRPDKGLQILSQQSEGKNYFSLLKDYSLASNCLIVSPRRERGERREENDLMKAQIWTMCHF